MAPTATVTLSNPDPLYGQVHPEETPQLLQLKLEELEDEIKQIRDPKKRSGYDQAVEKCPEQLTNDWKLQFLRCEVFNVKLAVERLMRYWMSRIESFGLEKAFLPMTQEGALKDDWKAIEYGFFNVLPSKAAMGRGIAYLNMNLEIAAGMDKSITRESMHRAVWYLVHAALEDVETQKHGLVYVVESQNTSILKVDNKLSKMNQRAAKGAIPVRMSSFHIIHPPAVLSIVWPFVKRILSKRLLNRTKVHYGTSNEDILSQLQGYEIMKDGLPIESGGTLKFDAKAWSAARRAQGK